MRIREGPLDLKDTKRIPSNIVTTEKKLKMQISEQETGNETSGPEINDGTYDERGSSTNSGSNVYGIPLSNEFRSSGMTA